MPAWNFIGLNIYVFKNAGVNSRCLSILRKDFSFRWRVLWKCFECELFAKVKTIQSHTVLGDSNVSFSSFVSFSFTFFFLPDQALTQSMWESAFVKGFLIVCASVNSITGYIPTGKPIACFPLSTFSTPTANTVSAAEQTCVLFLTLARWG